MALCPVSDILTSPTEKEDARKMGDPVRSWRGRDERPARPLYERPARPLYERPARPVRGHAGRVSLPKNGSFHCLPRQDL